MFINQKLVMRCMSRLELGFNLEQQVHTYRSRCGASDLRTIVISLNESADSISHFFSVSGRQLSSPQTQ